MSKTKRGTNERRAGRPERRISIRAVRRDPPDLKKLSQALIALAIAQAETEAQTEHHETEDASKRRRA